MMFISCIFFSSFVSMIVGSLSGTSPAAESSASGSEGDSDSTSTDFDNQQSTAMAVLLSSIQSRPEVSEKVAPVVQDKIGNLRMKLYLEYAVLAVISADEVLQTVSTAVYLNVSWMNRALAWNATEHRGILNLEFPAGSIWTPRLRLINSLEQVDLVEAHGSSLIVRYDGLVTSFITLYAETVCAMDMTHYPYDEQFCPLLFVFFSASGDWDVKESSMTQAILNFTSLSSTWTLEGVEKRTHQLSTYSCPAIIFHMKRKTVFYTVCLVLPMVITSYMNTMVFLIPPESGEKISFFVSVFVSTSVFVSFFTEVMPRGLETIPNVMKLLVGVLAEGLLILLTTILIIRRFHQEKASALFSNKFKKKGTSVCPLACQPNHPTTKNKVENCCDPEIKPAEDSSSSRLPKTYYLSAKLDHACFIMSLLGNTIFLLYLIIDSLSPKITKSR